MHLLLLAFRIGWSSDHRCEVRIVTASQSLDILRPIHTSSIQWIMVNLLPDNLRQSRLS